MSIATSRLPAVAGEFYPAGPEPLAGLVDAMLAEVPVGVGPAGRAYIVPHAGYRYSGPTASYVYSLVRLAVPRRVVLIGPSHVVALDGCAVPTTRSWQTPLGPVRVDAAGCRALVEAGLATADDRPHASEHALEVQLPFLQRVAGDVSILPIAVGVAPPEQGAAAIASAVESGPTAGTIVICSTDLSHYLAQDEAEARDAQTVRSVLALGRIGAGDACGVYALRALLAWAGAEGLRPRLLHRSTSADRGGPPERVVGYAALALADLNAA